MRRRLLIAALAFGTVAGYASGFHSLRACKYRGENRHRSFEQHVAKICADAARAEK